MANRHRARTATAPAAHLQGTSGRSVVGRRSVGVVVTLAVVALVGSAIASPNLRLVWNVSASVPLGIYRIEPDRRPRVGELAAVRPSPALARLMAKRRYVEQGALLVKPVAAISGAHVCRQGDAATIDGTRVATALPQDRVGRDLPRWSGCRRLAPGAYFLLAPGVRASFDSRYFGPVAAGAVLGRATPLWVWS